VNADQGFRRDLQQLGGDIRFDQPLARYGTYRIGGAAMAVLRPRSAEEVAEVLRLVSKTGIPVLPIGLGSNVLFDDAGFSGLVIRIANTITSIEQGGPEGSQWTVGAGLPIPRLARQSASLGFRGMQRLVGVPGAVGGGVFMNAGAHHQDFAQVVRTVSLVTMTGEIDVRPATDIQWEYRSSGLRGVVVGATLALEPADPTLVQRELRECLRRRRAGTPFDQPCCGSVFRNPAEHEVTHLSLPEPHTAGRLIEAVGLKGYRVGGAQVSPIHANYIVNTGGGTAAAVKRVIAMARERVRNEFGVKLMREVRYVGTTGIEVDEELE
jgi:UDP-N-acetylmuramate dehydrogenase